ncbi:MAG: 4-(cytidine 5'-diphospho)-2-C-methyl-D-erythritol kinase [Bacteroidota bacterium]
MVSFPNTKINLGLAIVTKRNDGFHNLESCFYPIPCYDVLEILPSEVTSFKSTGIEIPGEGNNNLCLKAYQLLKADFELPNFEFHLHKAIPIGAGLGGGSADGAFTLKLLNEINNLQLTQSQLEDYARKLGSDCAFFIENKPKYCFGKGDEFEEIEINLTGKYIVLVNPNIHISTAEAYAGVVPNQPKTNLREILKQPISAWKNQLENDFEKSLFPKYPVLPKIKSELYELGAEYVSMTGSGSTLYGIFEAEQNLSIFQNYWTFQKEIS